MFQEGKGIVKECTKFQKARNLAMEQVIFRPVLLRVGAHHFLEAMGSASEDHPKVECYQWFLNRDGDVLCLCLSTAFQNETNCETFSRHCVSVCSFFISRYLFPSK